MQTIVVSAVIQRPVEEVFAFVTDARNNLLWQASSGLQETRQLPDGPVGVGTRITEIRSFMGRTMEDVSEVTCYEPNLRYRRSPISDSGPVKDGEYTFEPVAEGVRWTITVNVQAGDIFAIAEPLLASNLRTRFEQNVAEAKALLERGIVEKSH